MTISTSSNNVVSQGNGVTINFNYGFLMDSASHAVVKYTDVNGIVSTIAVGQYTLTGVGNPAGGTYSYQPGGNPMPVGSTLQLLRVLPTIQGTNLQNQGNLYPAVIEAALDYLTMLIQQISPGSAVVFPQTSYSDMEVPTGTINGANAIFTIAHIPIPAISLLLFKNGVLQIAGVDYNLVNSTITYVVLAKPQIGDSHVCSYRYS